MFDNVLNQLSGSRLLRQIALPIFSRCNLGNVRIRHHYTGRPLTLHSYRHKGYWFHGRRREQRTMEIFRQLLGEGAMVVEVGGHIGYLTMLFADLVGSNGRVIAFEPGRNNLPYIRANVANLPNVELLESAVSSDDGVASFFEEELTGQNNSLLSDYEAFRRNRELAFSNEGYCQREVRTVRLDTFFQQRSLRPDFIKIDIEGAEFMALSGAAESLAQHLPMLMVEVTNRAEEVYDLLTEIGYDLFAPGGSILRDARQLNENVFALHPTRHRDQLRKLAWTDSRTESHEDTKSRAPA